MISYAQNYEDVILMRALASVKKGCYIDVGAQHPVNDSVTNAFYEKGWTGINIEPVDQWFKLLQSHRLDDVNINAVVSCAVGEHVFYEVVDTGLSTASPEIAHRHEADGREVVRRSVPALSLDEIIEAHLPESDIHFLKVDVEGAEDDVLRSISLDRHRPWVLVIEATEPNSQVPSFEAWEPFVLEARYELVYEDGLNRFYLAEEHKELKSAFGLPPNYFDFFMPYPEWWVREQLGVRDRELAGARRLSDLMLASERAGRAEAMVAELESALDRSAAEGAELKSRLDTIAQDRDALADQIAAMAREDAEIRAKLAESIASQAAVSKIEDERQNLQVALNASTAHVSKLHSRLVFTRLQRAQLASEVKSLRERLEQASRADAQHVSEQRALQQALDTSDAERQDLLRQVQRMVEAIAEADAESRRLERDLAAMRDQFAVEQNAWRDERGRLESRLEEIGGLVQHQDSLQRTLATKEQEIERMRAQVAELLGSHSWRVTAPLRAVRRALALVRRRLLGLLRRVLVTVLRAATLVPGSKRVARRLLAHRPVLKERLVGVMSQGYERHSGAGAPEPANATESRASEGALPRSVKEALEFIKRHRRRAD